VRVREYGRLSLFAPYLFARSSWRVFEVCVAFLEVSIDGGFGIVGRLVIAVVNDRTCHAAKYGFDYIKELGTCR
jgi:hypothetical protein